MDTTPSIYVSGGSIANARWADPDYISDKYLYDPAKGDVWIGRNPHHFDAAIGYRDERHIMVCAGAGSGKGRSFIVNNLALYPGSTITYDPKGELPYILAPRRGEGNEFCEGMGQKVFVLDPLKRSGVDEKYLGYCDPIAMLDPKDPELVTWCKRLARSWVKKREGAGDGQIWIDRGIEFTAMVIEHVVTSSDFDDDERSIHTVWRLIVEGDLEGATIVNEHYERLAKQQNAELGEGERPKKPLRVKPHEVLLRQMLENENATRFLAPKVRKVQNDMEQVAKYFVYVSGEAAANLDWITSDSMDRMFNGWGDETRRFDPRRLKTEAISLFIVMPVDDLDLYEPWLQSLFIGIFAAMREDKVKPKFPVLTFLDEFSSLGYQEYIATSLDNIRGAGMKLCFIVQNYGKLKKLYGDETESFFTNSGLELYFGKIGQTATDYLKKELGETQVVMTARSANRSETDTETVSNAITFGQTTSEGSSETHTAGSSFSFSNGVNWQDSENYGQGESTSMGTNYGPHVFFQGFQHSNSYGTQINKNQGRGRAKGGTKSTTKSKNESTAKGRTYQTGTSYSQTETTSKAKGYQIGGGIAESFHKKPLLDAHEINSHLRAIPDADCDHPAFPGLMLVRIAGEDPFFVRRSNYDQDPLFEGRFSEDPLHKFLPLQSQPLLGFEYTPEHVVTLTLPKLLRENGFEVVADIRPQQRFEEGQTLFSYQGPDDKKEEVTAPVTGRAIALADDEAFDENGAVVTIKAAKILDDDDQLNFKKKVFSAPIARVKSALEIAERKRQEEQARLDAEKDAAFSDYTERVNYARKMKFWNKLLFRSQERLTRNQLVHEYLDLQQKYGEAPGPHYDN